MPCAALLTSWKFMLRFLDGMLSTQPYVSLVTVTCWTVSATPGHAANTHKGTDTHHQLKAITWIQRYQGQVKVTICVVCKNITYVYHYSLSFVSCLDLFFSFYFCHFSLKNINIFQITYFTIYSTYYMIQLLFFSLFNTVSFIPQSHVF